MSVAVNVTKVVRGIANVSPTSAWLGPPTHSQWGVAVTVTASATEIGSLKISAMNVTVVATEIAVLKIAAVTVTVTATEIAMLKIVAVTAGVD